MQDWQTLKESRPDRPRNADGTYLTRHGRKVTPLYSVWAGMFSRCHDNDGEKYSIYGGRGISVDPIWRTFEPFEAWALANGYQKGLQIDRKDTNGNYTPENCRFVTCQENNNNRRNNRLVMAFGELKTVAQWGRDSRCAVDVAQLYKRFGKMPAEMAISMPPRAGSSLVKRSARFAY